MEGGGYRVESEGCSVYGVGWRVEGERAHLQHTLEVRRRSPHTRQGRLRRRSDDRRVVAACGSCCRQDAAARRLLLLHQTSQRHAVGCAKRSDRRLRGGRERGMLLAEVARAHRQWSGEQVRRDPSSCGVGGHVGKLRPPTLAGVRARPCLALGGVISRTRCVFLLFLSVYRDAAE